MNELLGKTLVELVACLRNKEASAVELMEATLARIDSTNPDLNAVVAMHGPDKLISDARAADARIAAGNGRALEVGKPNGLRHSLGGLVEATEMRLDERVAQGEHKQRR